MNVQEELDRRSDLELADEYRSVTQAKHLVAPVSEMTYWVLWDLGLALEVEMRRRNIGHDGRPLAAVNVTALVD